MLAGLLTVGPVMALGSVQVLASRLTVEPVMARLMALAAKSPASAASSPFRRLCVPCVQR